MCLARWYIDNVFYETIAIRLAWTSFERHIIVSHNPFVWLFHYFSMIFFTLYELIFYFSGLLVPACE
jgi:hypothetical protein